MTFFDRSAETAFLEGLSASGLPKLLVVYGRRRVGKSELLKHFVAKANGVYLEARQESDADILKNFSRALAQRFEDRVLAASPLGNWDALFEYLRARVPEGTPVVFDEFPYVVEANASVPSILQSHWDNFFQKRRSFIILCGSSVRMMERLLGYKSPLYGRRTEQLKVTPLGFFNAVEFMPRKMPAERKAEFYSVLGGTPAYMLEIDFSKDVWSNIAENILPTTKFLNQDVLFVLREELDEPRNYFSILKSIAKGNTTLGLITNETGLEKQLVGKYLSVLRDLEVVERRVPVTEKKNESSRKGIYEIKDSFFRFWFRFVFDAQATGTQPNLETVETRIKPFFNAFVGKEFEHIALAWLNSKPKGFLKGVYFGAWWDNANEIDAVGLGASGKKALLFEVKWGDLKLSESLGVLSRLEEKKNASPDLRNYDASYGIIARSLQGKSELEKRGYAAFELEDIMTSTRK